MKKILLALIVLLSFFYFFGIYKISGTSMNYGLLDNDIVITYRKFNLIERGDMLVVKHPFDPDNRLYIKRCAALPGDIFFEDKRSFYLQLDGNSTKTKKLAQKYDIDIVSTKNGYFIKDPYVKYYGVVHNWRLDVPKVLTKLPISLVKKDHFLMLGDYRDNSADSRFFGAVPRSWVFSKVAYILKIPRSWDTLLQIEETDK